MSIKMLMFDFREEEQAYFDRENTEDFEITFFKESLTKNVVQNLPYVVRQNTTVISVFIDSKVDKEVIDAFPNLMIISTRSTGFNHIDLEEAKKQNIKCDDSMCSRKEMVKAEESARNLLVVKHQTFFARVLDKLKQFVERIKLWKR